MSDDVLYAISTIGKLSFEKYRGVFDTLYGFNSDGGAEVDRDQVKMRYDLLRLLEALGHGEYSTEQRALFVCPPSLVLLPTTGLPKAVLTGARSPDLIQKLEGFQRANRREVFLLQVKQSYGTIGLPQAIYIEGASTGHIRGAASAANVNCSLEVPAAWRLACFSSGIDEVKATLIFTERHEPRWKKLTFSSEDLSFKQYYSPQNGGLKLVSYRDPVTQQLHYWLWDGDRAATVDREWAQYLVLANRRAQVLVYDSQRHRLAVPSTIPLPRLLARVATLCTGHVPSVTFFDQAVGDIKPKSELEVYDGITHPLAELISKKLGLVLAYNRLVIDKENSL